MSTKYKQKDIIPSEVLCKRLEELSDAVSRGKSTFEREFTMRYPAELDHDADLVLSAASRRIRDLESGNIPYTKYTFTDNISREFNDKIPVGMSPSDLERFYQTYKSKAEICRDYDTQKTYHKIVDFLKHHLSGYYSARKIFDSDK